MNPILTAQLALDYCCTPDEAADDRNHFTIYTPLEGRRTFRETEDCFLKAAVVNEKLLMAGQPEIIGWCRETFADTEGKWFMDGRCLAALQDRLRESGCRLGSLHPFLIAETPTDPGPLPFSVRWYEGADIEAFRGDERFSNAFTFEPTAPDMLGVGAFDESGRLLGMAGASRDSETMWQIGIDVRPEARGRHVGVGLVTLLKNEILRRGRLPFYGTAFSHAASLRVGLGAGFRPAWSELYTAKTE